MCDTPQAASDATTTRRCSYCNTPETVELKLKRCGGCFDPDVVYCSVVCQKIAWRSHKSVCRGGTAVVLARAPPSADDAWERLEAHPVSGNETLYHCDGCHQPQSQGKSLKKCGACATLYCSSECQKRAWPRHKSRCIPKEDHARISRVGSGQMSFGVLSREWSAYVRAHAFAFRNIAYAMCLLHFQASRERDPSSIELPRLIRFRMRYLPSPVAAGSRDPASKFMVVGHSFGDLETAIREEPKLWARVMAVREEADRIFSVIPGHGSSLAVEFYIPDADTSAMVEWYPLRAPLQTSPHDPATTTAVLNDLITFCMYSMNLGFPLRIIKPGDIFPRPGRFVRSGKNWKFEELFPDWSDYKPGQHRGLDYAHSQLKSGRAVPVLFHFLLIEQGIITEDVQHDALRRMGIPEWLIPLLPEELIPFL
ncbi:hypothetical protein L226DRAFT_103713 [Lentinus tigrinus ALCF2SS1-7]|uniref:MYND-type domain-containing protein n=1 Tax=Lentinus tigrinus ALCF2SS1-6 TaxID=1328759 RepID=A0A5C2S7Q3_9APHY|nr:hypothetical protein L227DRAFT_167308 [Lentinus tigrinus ALCF2SS1-6]RPD73583.1 hypothetical protein L226DRAFT_103713 [Lentinus tigrinus ALCF2SS1-7]